MPRNPYDVLGVDPGASDGAIRDAYRRRLRLLHPDHHANDDPLLIEEATKATVELNEAYALLSDSAARSRYDAEVRFRADRPSTKSEPDRADHGGREERRPAQAGECDICGCTPAAAIQLLQVSSRLLFVRYATWNLEVCRPCGLTLFRTVMNHCLLFGWWGPIAFLSNIGALVVNTCSWLTLRKLRSLYRSPVVVTPLTYPMDPGSPLGRRLGVWVTGAAVAVFLLPLLGSSSDPAEETSLSWKVGACVRAGSSQVSLVSCGEQASNGTVVARVASGTNCPARAESYVEKGSWVYCIDEHG